MILRWLYQYLHHMPVFASQHDVCSYHLTISIKGGTMRIAVDLISATAISCSIAMRHCSSSATLLQNQFVMFVTALPLAVREDSVH